MATEKGTSVLASLTASVMAEKRTEARKLTPVEGEFQAPFPSDLNGPGQPKGFMSHETMRDAAKDLRRHAQQLIDIADALDAMSGFATGDTVKPVDDTKQREAEADARAAAREAAAAPTPDEETTAPTEEPVDFNAAFAEKQRLAQEAVFKQQPEQVDLGWLCPEHGKATVKTSAKTQRQYVGCPDCNQFKR